MTKENAHLYLPLVQALAEGRTVQFRPHESHAWDEDQNVDFTASIKCYRIKPEPKTVPLGPEDVPIGSAIGHPGVKGEFLITGITEGGLEWRNNFMQSGSYGFLMKEGYRIKRPGGEWEACHKQVSE
jgi:hypothetical protein